MTPPKIVPKALVSLGIANCRRVGIAFNGETSDIVLERKPVLSQTCLTLR
jgi:hypothetical protein